MIQKRWMVLGWVVVVLLSGCACGTPPVTAPAKPEAAIVWQAAPTRVAELNGRHYYLLQEGFTCAAGMIPGTAEPSWREHVSISSGQLLDWGTLCNDTQMLIGPVDAALEVSPDLATLRYQGKIYRHFVTPPQLRGAGGQHD